MSKQTDSAGTIFDAAKHQMRGGSPLTRKSDGRFVPKGKRGPINGKGRAQVAQKRAAKSAAPAPAESAPAAAPAPAPSEIPVATATDVLGDWPADTGGGMADDPSEDEGESAEGASDAPAQDKPASAPGLSTLSPDNAPLEVPNVAVEAVPGFVVETMEMGFRMGIDAEEWKLKDNERVLAESTMKNALADWLKDFVVGPWCNVLMVWIMIAVRRGHLPKTRAVYGKGVDWFVGLFRKKLPATPPPADPVAAPVAAAPEPLRQKTPPPLGFPE